MVRALDLQSKFSTFKSFSCHKIDLCLVVLDSTPRSLVNSYWSAFNQLQWFVSRFTVHVFKWHCDNSSKATFKYSDFIPSFQLSIWKQTSRLPREEKRWLIYRLVNLERQIRSSFCIRLKNLPLFLSNTAWKSMSLSWMKPSSMRLFNSGFSWRRDVTYQINIPELY